MHSKDLHLAVVLRKNIHMTVKMVMKCLYVIYDLELTVIHCDELRESGSVFALSVRDSDVYHD